MGLKSFFQTILLSFNPVAYEKLCERKLTSAVNYYFSMAAVMFLVMFLLFLPAIITLPGTIERELASFSTLDIKLNQSMTGPIKIPGIMPKIIIDSSKEYTNIEEGKVLITDDAVFYKLLPFTEPKKIVREPNLLDRKDQLGTLLALLLIAMLPTLLVAAFVYFTIKYLLAVILASLIAFVIVRVARFGITMAELLKVGFFASTIMVAVGLLTKPFVPMVYYIEYALFLAFFIMGIAKVGSFESVVKPKKTKPSMYEG